MSTLWTKLDRKDKSTWPDNGQHVVVSAPGKKQGTFNLAVAQTWHSRDSVSVWKFWKWEDAIFFRGARFIVEYWRPLINKDFPDCEL